MKTIPTPLTDSTEGSDGSQPECGDLADLARALERELAGEIEKVRVLREALTTLSSHSISWTDGPFSPRSIAKAALAATEDAP